MGTRSHFANTNVALAFVASLVAATSSEAATKDECVEAHGRGQDLKDHGLLTRAQKVFLACAQNTCPQLVQDDCARFGEEVTRLVPTVSFAARDALGADLPNTSVYVDDALVTTRLEDGKALEFDPGKHVVRFVHASGESTIRIVLNQGEKGRVIAASFTPEPPKPLPTSAPPKDGSLSESRRSVFPLVVAAVGVAVGATGGALVGIGAARVPDTCSLASRTCSGPEGDPSLSKAQDAARLVNVGVGVGIAGAAMLVGGAIVYLVQPTGNHGSARARAFEPVFRF